MAEQLENTRPRFIPENPFSLDFNEVPSTAFDTTRTDTALKDKDKKDSEPGTQAIPDTSQGPRPGNIPSVKLSQGTDVFLPDVNLDLLDPSVLNPNKSKPEGKAQPGGKPPEQQGPPPPPGKPAGDAGSDSPVQTDKPQTPADTTPKNVFVNAETKKIDKIDYAGRAREFQHDPQRGLVGVKETGPDGPREYVKRSDGNDARWFMKAGSVELPLAGEFDLRPNGDFLLRNSSTQPWQVESPDGKVTIERPRIQSPAQSDAESFAPGRVLAEVSADKHGNVGTVKLPDGSNRSYKFDDTGEQLLQITDRVKTSSGERVEEWTRQALPTGGFGEKFVRTNPPGGTETRENIKQLGNGAYEYTDANGERKTSHLAAHGDGKPQTPWKANVQMDEQGRFKAIENDRFKRTYEYFEGTTKIKSYHVVDKQNGQSTTWSRQSPTSGDWTGKTGDGRTATMKGEFAITDDGVHVVQKLSASYGGGAENYAFLGNGAKVGIKATEEGKGLAAAEGGQARYVKRADGSSVAYTNNDNTEISVFDGQTKQRTTWTKGADGMWKSDSPYEPDARKDLKFNEQGELSYVDDRGNTRTRTLAGEDIIAKKDGSKLVYDNQGKLSRVMFGDTTRTFQKDDQGAITAVLDSNSQGESRTVFPPGLHAGQKVEDAKLDENGDLSYTVKSGDGKVESKITERSNGLRLEHDADGFLTKSGKPNGITRKFEYAGEGASKQLVMVTDTRATKDGERSTVWARQPQASGGFSEDFHSQAENGKARTPRKIGNVHPDGEYEYLAADAKPGDKPRIQGLNAGDGTGFSGSVEESRFSLLESMERNLDEPRLRRMEEMMKAYEQRMMDRAQARKLAGVTSAEKIDEDVSQTVSRTYDHLAQMVNSDDGNTFFDKQQRAFLAENFMYHAQDPTTMDQGSAGGQDWDGHGTCWIQAAHIWGLTQRTDHMADLLKQVSLTGSYTTKNSGTQGDQPKTVTFSKNHLKFPDGFQESNWCISKASDTWDRQPGLIRQCDGDRSPVGKIFDYTLPVIGNRSQSARAMDGGTHESFRTTGNRWYVGNAEIMQMVTGDKPCDVSSGGHGKGTLIDGDMRKTLLEKGTVLNYSPGHMKSIHLKQVDGKWCLIQDNQHGENDDRIIARISDLEAWARGDRGAEQRVNEYVKQTKYKLETDSTIRGTIKPTADSKEYNNSSNGQYYPQPHRQYRQYRGYR